MRGILMGQPGIRTIHKCERNINGATRIKTIHK
jgi:hypothetical protein